MQLLNRILLCGIFCVLTVGSVSAQNIRVQGIITSIPSGKQQLSITMIALDMTLQLDTLLAEFAVVDSDIIDIYELVKQKNDDEGINE